jgi:hypothetical protein
MLCYHYGKCSRLTSTGSCSISNTGSRYNIHILLEIQMVFIILSPLHKWAVTLKSLHKKSDLTSMLCIFLSGNPCQWREILLTNNVNLVNPPAAHSFSQEYTVHIM